MKNVFFGILCILTIQLSAFADDAFLYDTSNPMFIQEKSQVLSKTGISFIDSTLRFGQKLSYGISNDFNIGAEIYYQHDFHKSLDGFTAVDIGGTYRLAQPDIQNNNIITDVILGVKLGGSSHFRTPYYADSTYYAGLKIGRQWNEFTLSGVVKSSWIFDTKDGMAYIDFIPQLYLRLNPDWRIGGEFMWRRATDPNYDQQWLSGKLVRQYGRTQYIGILEHEFESHKTQVSFNINILF